KEAVEKAGTQDVRAARRARKDAEAEAKKTAAKKIAETEKAVTRQDIGSVTAELAKKFEDQLVKDFDETIKGALKRFGPTWLKQMQQKLEKERKRITKEKTTKPKVKKGETPPPEKPKEEIEKEIESEMSDVRCDVKQWGRDQLERIAFAWAVGRREEVDFLTIPQTAKFLKDFAPTYMVGESEKVEIPSRLQQEENARKGVAPELADFLGRLATDPGTPPFTASNRPGHGGGSWAGRGFSTDIFINASIDKRGFWQHDIAVKFLLAVDAKAKAMGARWRVLYNDFGVAQEVNKATGALNVVFIGTSRSNKGLNWHGPQDLILHFHLDLEIPKAVPKASTP